jgi:hypothetical protein
MLRRHANTKPALGRCLLALLCATSGGCGGLGAGEGAMVDEYGVHLSFAQRNTPDTAQVSHWVGDVVAFFRQHYDTDIVHQGIRGHLVEFVDHERIEIHTRAVRAYTVVGYTMVGMRESADGSVDWTYVESLFKHELAHAILDAAGVPWDEALHHETMKELGYEF